MEELTIDDKKYISSKRAAELTGYAKDYVGQLCREGYVEAKRVGRSWYVLESAITDHRFGSNPSSTIETSPAPAASGAEKAWVPLKYEPAQPAELPSINRLRSQSENKVESPAVEAEELGEVVPDQGFHEAWQGWFDTFRGSSGQHQGETESQFTIEPVVDLSSDSTVPAGLRPEPAIVPGPDEEPVPLHKLVQAPSSPLRHAEALDPLRYMRIPEPEKRPVRKSAPYRMLLMTTLSLITLGSITLAAIGTGYFDDYIISYERGSIFTGVNVYK